MDGHKLETVVVPGLQFEILVVLDHRVTGCEVIRGAAKSSGKSQRSSREYGHKYNDNKFQGNLPANDEVNLMVPATNDKGIVPKSRLAPLI